MLAPHLERQRALLEFVVDPRNGEAGIGELRGWGEAGPDPVRLRHIARTLFKGRIARLRRALPKTCAAIWLELAAVIEDFCVAHPPETIQPNEEASAFCRYLVGREENLFGAPDHIGDLAKFEVAIANTNAGQTTRDGNSHQIDRLELFEGRFDLGPLFDRLRRAEPIERRPTNLAIWRDVRSGHLRIVAVPPELFSDLVRLKVGETGIEQASPAAHGFLQAHDMLESGT